VPDGRKRGGIHRRGWPHRHTAAQPFGTAQAADDADATRPDSGVTDTVEEPDPAASLDQVLRRAAEARDAERDRDD
jgi:hypothetical protein